MVNTQNRQPKLLFPRLERFYNTVSDLWYPVIRIAVGGRLFMHGWQKIGVGIAGVTAYFSKIGLEPAVAFAYAAMFLETVGAICVALGLFTRFFAAALVIELAIAVLYINLSGFLGGRGGYEIFLGIVMFAIALHGGGSYSVDRLIGKEL
jgi:putative oxidoreductase